VHFIVESRDRLARIAAFVRETRRRGTLEPVIVFTGRRDDLGLTDAQIRELALDRPDVELDVPRGPSIVQSARVMERYHALLELGRPAVVVVGASAVSVACALVARERSIPVAQVAGPSRPAEVRPLEPQIADLVLVPRVEGDKQHKQLLFGGQASTEAEVADLVPALEALLVSHG
jgi:UDP-N-acetylglucosamine 2-epimerase